MAKEKPVNLFGWNSRGIEVTNELRAILKKCGWEEAEKQPQYLHFERRERTAIHFVTSKRWGKKLLWLHDNGGEVNLGWDTTHGEFLDIPTMFWSTHLNARTFFYRLRRRLRDQPIDYDKIIENRLSTPTP